MTAQHREALAHLVYGLNSEGGCILLTGEVGTGKTTICRCLLEQIPDQANVALVLNPKLNEIELLETICDELHIDYPDSDNSLKTYTDRIYKFLIESNRRGEKTVLIIDEAQNLDSRVLEQLRLLTNLETNQRKLLQIIILGQPELLNILAKTEMRQLAQRITARFHLEPLDKHELKAYISHRLAVAGQNIQLFPEKSIKLLYRYSKGVPRLINIICDRALLGAYVENQYTVSPRVVKKATIEVFGELKNVEKHQQKKQWLYPLAAFTSVAIIALLIAFYFYSIEKTEDTQGVTGIADVQNKAVADDAENYTKNDTQTSLIDSPIEGELENQTPEVQNTDITEEMTATHVSNDQVSNDQASNTELNNPAVVHETPEIDTALNNTGEEAYDDIDKIIKTASTNPAPAYQELFKTWNQDFDNKTRLTACKQAEKLSLSCLFKNGNISSLKRHNRPAVLTLLNDQGRKRYLTITSITDDITTVISDNKTYRIKLQDLNKYWYGQFTLLWKKPEHYSSVITPGDSGNVVNWLSLQLEKINNTPTPDIIISKYDDYLINKVKMFQSQQGLTADGIVGPITIIHLNNKSGIEAPYLMSPPIQSVMRQG
ncbi:MAG: AAA family ATPase [Gammaproteobacteria bacterium]